MIQLIATDMDGTLLDREGKISEQNRKALRLVQERGILVVIATGRSYHGAMDLLRDSGLHVPLIYLNGACIRSEKDELMKGITLEPDAVRRMHEAFQEIEIYHELYTGDGIYCNRDGYNYLKIEIDRIISTNPTIQPELARHVANRKYRTSRITEKHYEDIAEDPGASVYKVLAFSTIDEKLKQARQKAKSFSGIVVTSSARHNIELNHPDAQKGLALEYLAQKYGISMKQTMVIGDNFNDLSMMKKAGLSIAMGNAEEYVKKACRYVTRSNDEHGVAYAISRWAGIGELV
ncbi:Cof-type HAD-IIB family hydrolase [Thermoactinomyces mirandus]|uniref:HAD family phosphatase n=1 Tax=Thermoactinomyces mirandus TaxID=2756294 RepID=A0A7W1XS43_9BACL|nr:Cof-type HAD-IIB family hydrolase [Thermoactinomyces mirandus]MBA4602279.1 HAD family phosphatase [Thermoactinomyces mirandus]